MITSAAIGSPKTVVLANTNRFALIGLVAMATVCVPPHLVASAAALGQMTPVKPSADVPLPASLPATQPTAASEAGPKPIAEQLNVELIDGKVTVDATNASLNGVLKDIAGKAGIKITGTVADERVFGHYGPARPSDLLATLLDGTASNMLLVDDASGGSELVLTPRVGGPTPPNPATAAADRAAEQQQDDRSSQRFGAPPNRPFQPGRGPLTVPPNIGAQIPGGGRPTVQPDADPTDASQTGTDQRTPQQIYDQLQNQNQQRPAPPQ